MGSSIHLYRRLEYLDFQDVWSTRAWYGTPCKSARNWEWTWVLYGLTLQMLMAQFPMHWLSLQWSSCGLQWKWGISSCSTTVISIGLWVYNQPVHNIMADLKCFVIPKGCAISHILFVLAIEIIIRAAEKAGPGVSLRGAEELPPKRGFMDDLTLLNPSTEAVETILSKLEQLMDWGEEI